MDPVQAGKQKYLYYANCVPRKRLLPMIR